MKNLFPEHLSKITTIKESKDIASMSMEALLGKLLAYEHEF